MIQLVDDILVVNLTQLTMFFRVNAGLLFSLGLVVLFAMVISCAGYHK